MCIAPFSAGSGLGPSTNNMVELFEQLALVALADWAVIQRRYVRRIAPTRTIRQRATEVIGSELGLRLNAQGGLDSP